MTEAFDELTLRRFQRTMRVALNTALAEYNVTGRRSASGSAIVFRALAAKGPGAFRFPQKGISSSDGLLLATVERGQYEEVVSLRIQAQGSVGLTTFAGRQAEVEIGFDKQSGRFGRDGGLEIALSGPVDEQALASFDLRLVGDLL